MMNLPAELSAPSSFDRSRAMDAAYGREGKEEPIRAFVYIPLRCVRIGWAFAPRCESFLDRLEECVGHLAVEIRGRNEVVRCL